MILLKSKKLEQQLARKKISEWEKVKYLIFPMILTSILGGPIFLIRPRYGVQPPPLNMYSNLIGGFLIAIVTYWGIRRLYLTNVSIDGEDFITRYTVLSLPVFLKFTIWLILGGIIFSFVTAALTIEHKHLRQYVPVLLNMIFPGLIAWYYILVNRSLKRFEKHANENVDV